MKLFSLLSLPSAALRLPATALRTAATALRVMADVNAHVAERLTLDEDDTPDAAPNDRSPATARRRVPAPVVEQTAAAVATPLPAPEAVEETEPAPVLDVAALAASTAPQVIAALDTMSIEDLAELYEYESRHRRRRTVLDAIDRATAPPAPAAGADTVIDLEDDVRQPDELVYSTETPRR